MFNKKINLFVCILLILFLSAGIVSATEINSTQDTYENENSNVEMSQQIVVNNNMNEINAETESTETNNVEDSIVKKNITSADNQKTATVTNIPKSLSLNVSVVNDTIDLVTDFGNEVAITKNITTVNGIPDVTKLGVDYAYVDENGVYTIEGAEIRRVMRLDSFCQQIYGFVPKYTFFRAVGSNVKYVISREKWNVIARSLNGYHVDQGFTAVDTPYAITVNLSGASRYYGVYFDAQEIINGHSYTCGPTSMSMISQALNSYASERRLSEIYETTSRDGTDEDKIIKYSPSVYMKMTDITNSESAVKSALNAGKMVFWHISGHYMCVISYNSVTNRFLCLNPSGPSHNIAAVQWATWTEMMNTDRPLKEHGFMAVTPYRNLNATDKTHAAYYYYNMGGKYTVSPNNEYTNNGYDNKVSVTVNKPSNVPNKTNKTTFKITAQVNGSTGVLNEGKIELYLNNQLLKTETVKNGIVSLNYTIPAYVADKITVTAKYVGSLNIDWNNVSTTFYKFTAGKNYHNSTKFNSPEGIYVNNVTAKKGDTVTFTAYVRDVDGTNINNGKVVFKLNGNTLRQNGTPIKISVVDGVAKLNFKIPAYSAKNYRLTAVFGNNTHRFENSANLTIQKLDTKISGMKFTKVNETGLLIANVVDENGDKVERETKITIKINGKTVVNKVKVQDGHINMTLDLSKYRSGTHNLTIIAGENGLYKTSSLNTTITKENSIPQLSVSIKNLKITNSANRYNLAANIIDANGAKIEDNVKLSIKLNGKTVANKIVVSNGIINQNLDLSNYDKGTHNLTMIVGETNKYKSYVLNTTISKS